MHLWLWIIVFIAAIILEIVTVSSLISIWFAVGAVFGLIAYLLGFGFIWQVVLFFAASFLCIACIRPFAKDYLRGNIIATNADRMIGHQTTLLKAISLDHWGEIKVHGVTWNAAEANENEIAEGSLVEIVALEGSKCVVKQVS